MMHYSEIKSCVDNAVIIYDSREQINPRFEERMNGIKQICKNVKRVKIDEGDYSIATTLPDGSEISLIDKVGIERKKDLNELAQCFGSERERFKREVLRAKKKGKKLYLLVENASFDYLCNDLLYKAHCSSRYNRSAMLMSIISWNIKYGFTPVFVSERNSGEMIAKILRKELELELERLCDE